MSGWSGHRRPANSRAWRRRPPARFDDIADGAMVRFAEEFRSRPADEPVFASLVEALDVVFAPEQIVSYISQMVTLHPGDLIFTGTPSGVGAVRRGETMTAAIEGLGASPQMLADFRALLDSRGFAAAPRIGVIVRRGVDMGGGQGRSA